MLDRIGKILNIEDTERGHKELAVAKLWIVHPDQDQALRVAVGKAANHHRLEHAEDGDVGPEAERQGGPNRERQQRRFEDGPEVAPAVV